MGSTCTVRESWVPRSFSASNGVTLGNTVRTLFLPFLCERGGVFPVGEPGAMLISGDGLLDAGVLTDLRVGDADAGVMAFAGTAAFVGERDGTARGLRRRLLSICLCVGK